MGDNKTRQQIISELSKAYPHVKGITEKPKQKKESWLGKKMRQISESAEDIKKGQETRRRNAFYHGMRLRLLKTKNIVETNKLITEAMKNKAFETYLENKNKK